MSIVNSNQWGQIKEEINNNALSRSGGQIIGDINMGGNNITNVGDAINDGDVVNKGSLKTLRPFAIQLVELSMDFGHSPTGATEVTISLNPEFNQNFANFVFLRMNYTSDVIVPRGGKVNYWLYSANDEYEMSIEHFEESSSFKFTVTGTYGGGSTMQTVKFLVIGIN